MAYFGVSLSNKLDVQGYSRILCTDPMLFCLRLGPFLATLIFAFIILTIKKKVLLGEKELEIEEGKKLKRLKTLKRL
jgi:hypothetical protein